MHKQVKFDEGNALVYNDFIEYHKNFKKQEINDGVDINIENTILSIAKEHPCRFVRINHKDIAKRVCEFVRA